MTNKVRVVYLLLVVDRMIKTFCFIFVITLTCSMDVPECSCSRQKKLRLNYWDGSQDSTTVARICHDNVHLIVKWESKDKEIVAPYENCNDPLFNADSVEIFIATEESYPYNYYEFEVSPNEKLFFADIYNPGVGGSLDTTYMDCGLVQYST
jgi:hypothetical protein